MYDKINEIVALAKKNDQKAQVELFNSIKKHVSGVGRRYVWDKTDLEDLTQEVLIRIFDKLHQFDPEKGDFKGWVYRLSVNSAINFIKKKQDFKSLFVSQDLDNIEEIDSIVVNRNEIEEKLTTEAILKVLDDLPIGRRTIFNLFYIEGYRHEEIAEMLGITKGTSKSQLYWAKEAFLKNLNKNKIEIR